MEYRKYIKEKVLEFKKIDSKINFSALAKSIGVSPHYLSRVLNQKGDLSEDQVFLASQYLGLGDLEVKRLELSYALARSTLQKRKKLLKNELLQLEKSMSSTKSHLSTPQTEAEQEHLTPFFLNPKAQLVYAALFIKRFQAEPKQLCGELLIGDWELVDTLKLLEDLRLVCWVKSKCFPIAKRIHLSRKHSLFSAYERLIRQEMNQFSDSKLKVSAFTSVGKMDVEKIHEILLEALKKIEEISLDAEPQELIGIQVDLVSCLQTRNVID